MLKIKYLTRILYKRMKSSIFRVQYSKKQKNRQ